jgi:hypothetical protein
MPTDFKFRGCCCGVPIGCGTLAFAAVLAALWKIVPASWLSLAWLPF